MSDSGKSKPDNTSADNPSSTGVPSVDSQGRDAAVKGGSQQEQRSQSDSERNPNNHTAPYGTDNVNAKQTGNKETARAFAERGVVEKHGEHIRQNPQFEELVKEEQRQVAENQRNTAWA